MADFIQELANWDLFFYYGKSEPETESLFDLYLMLLQPKRSLYYNRKESAGLTEYENNPNDLNLQIFARFEIANAVAYKNSVVVNGTEGTRDRRIAVSQNSIGFEAKNGNLDVQILYFLYADYEQPRQNSFPIVK
jgi:hypothetical protein